MAISTRLPRTLVTRPAIPFDGHAAFEGKAEFGEELNRAIDVFNFRARRHDPSPSQRARR